MNSIKIKISILFLTTVAISSLFLPALFNYWDSYLVVIFMAFVIICGSLDKSLIFLGVIFCLLAELYWGLSFGALALPFLTTLALFLWIGHFLNIKINLRRNSWISDLAAIIFINVILSFFLTLFFSLFQNFIYASRDGWSAFIILNHNPGLLGELIIAPAVYWYFLRTAGYVGNNLTVFNDGRF